MEEGGNACFNPALQGFQVIYVVDLLVPSFGQTKSYTASSLSFLFSLITYSFPAALLIPVAEYFSSYSQVCRCYCRLFVVLFDPALGCNAAFESTPSFTLPSFESRSQVLRKNF